MRFFERGLRAKIILIVLISHSVCWGDADPSKLKIYFFKQPIQAPIWARDDSGTWKQTEKVMFFREGQYFKVDGVSDNGTLWVKSFSEKGYEVVGITPEMAKGNNLTNGPFQKETPPSDAGSSDAQSNVKVVERLESGPGNLIRRWMGHKGIEDAQVYFDATAGRRVALMSDPGGHTCRPEAKEKDPCVAWPSTADSLQILDSTIKVTTDPVTGQTSPKLYYKVQTTYCPSGPKEKCSEPLQKNKVGWIEARRVGPTKRDIPANSDLAKDSKFNTTINGVSSSDKPCPDPMTKQISNLKEVTKAAKEDFDSKYTWKIGQCLISGNNKNYGELTKKFFSEAPKRSSSPVALVKNQKNQSSTDDKLATDQQLYEIDVLARTLFGEMRSCNEQSPVYYKAVARVLLNRAAIVKSEGFTPPFVNQKSKSAKTSSDEHQLMADVASSRLQISSWNSKDPNIRVNLCPGLETASEEGKDAWTNAVRVAADVVLHKEKFLKETKEITHTHYTSGMIPSWSKQKKRQVSFKIDGKTYSNSNCLILWADGFNKKIERLDDKPLDFVSSGDVPAG